MADLTASDISRLLAPTNEGVRSLTIEQEKTTEYIENLNSTLADILATVDKLFKQVATGDKKNKPPVIEGTSKPQTINPLDSISNHLNDIKKFLVKTFRPTGLSGSTEDTNVGMASSLTKEAEKTKEEKLKEKLGADKASALSWLGGLFTVGALGELSKILGVGGAVGGSSALLAKVATKIFKFSGKLLKRIPILGSLFSFYEAYKNFKAGGIDNYVFGLMDIAAGIGYMLPGVGWGIAIGIDVLQYFLKNKADEWKAKTGETSFFGSMYDKLIEYLSETPMIKWMAELGTKFSALWDNPSLETLGDFAGHLAYAPLMPLINALSMLNDASSFLGLTDESGNPQKLFGWLYDKVEDYIITPVKDMFTSIFDYIKDIINSVSKGVEGIVTGMVDALPDTMGLKDTVKGALGLAKEDDPGNEKTKLISQIKQRLGELYPKDPEKQRQERKKALQSDLPALQNQLKDLDSQLKLQETTPINQPERLPTLEETEKEYLNKLERKPTQNIINQTQINTHVTQPSPSLRHGYVAG